VFSNKPLLGAKKYFLACPSCDHLTREITKEQADALRNPSPFPKKQESAAETPEKARIGCVGWLLVSVIGFILLLAIIGSIDRSAPVPQVSTPPTFSTFTVNKSEDPAAQQYSRITIRNASVSDLHQCDVDIEVVYEYRERETYKLFWGQWKSGADKQITVSPHNDNRRYKGRIQRVIVSGWAYLNGKDNTRLHSVHTWSD
jgi:hypothetical protein